MPETAAHGNSWRSLTAKGVEEFKQFLVMSSISGWSLGCLYSTSKSFW